MFMKSKIIIRDYYQRMSVNRHILKNRLQNLHFELYYYIINILYNKLIIY